MKHLNHVKAALLTLVVLSGLWLGTWLVNERQQTYELHEQVNVTGLLPQLQAWADVQVRENYPFHGLARYYNALGYYLLNDAKLTRLEPGSEFTLGQTSQLLIVGRFKVLALTAPDLHVSLREDQLEVDESLVDSGNIHAELLSKNILAEVNGEYNQLRYQHLWSPFAWLTKLAESSIVRIQSLFSANWGIAVITFAILLKVVMLPISISTVRFQRQVSTVQSQLYPVLAEIKANYDGEEAHNRLMQAHKDLGVTPFYALKPMWGSLVQVPLLIAIFNALGEMPQFVQQPFFWINSLAYPDVIATLPAAIPLFGDKLSLLPVLMTLLTLVSTIQFENSAAPGAETKRQKRNLYFMAVAFLVLFYPFPAVMVLFWTLANLLQFVHQKLFKI